MRPTEGSYIAGRQQVAVELMLDKKSTMFDFVLNKSLGPFSKDCGYIFILLYT